MVRPNFIPRTKIGVGGVKLFDIPGVIYPDEILRAQPGQNKNGKPYLTPPEWGITTGQAAELLNCSPSAARIMLHKRRVTYRLVKEGNSRRLYWRESQVKKIAEERVPTVRSVSDKLIDSQEAVRILGVARSTLQRYTQRGRLRTVQVRFVLPNGGGTRLRSYFVKAEILKLSYRLAAAREHARELDELMNECDRRFAQDHPEVEREANGGIPCHLR